MFEPLMLGFCHWIVITDDAKFVWDGDDWIVVGGTNTPAVYTAHHEAKREISANGERMKSSLLERAVKDCNSTNPQLA